MSLKKPTAAELADLVREAHRSCRCDGGCTNCGACSAERKLDMYIRSGLVVRTAASKAFTDPTYALAKKPAVTFHGVVSGRFSSKHPNQANTPQAAGHIRKRENYDGNVEGCIADCPGCKEGTQKVRWIMHAFYAHVAGLPCATCNPPTELERYRDCMKNCYCPAPTASGYKPLCGNCQEAQKQIPAILERLGIK